MNHDYPATFVFRRLDNGEFIERTMTYREYARDTDETWCLTLEDGVKAERDVEEERRRRKPVGLPGYSSYGEGKPLVSEGLGVMPRQVQWFREDAAKHGFTGIDFNAKGQCIISDRGDRGRRGYLKHRGLHDEDGCYGDG